jgi:hypothetical protein
VSVDGARDSRRAASGNDSFSSVTSFTASRRNSLVYLPCGIAFNLTPTSFYFTLLWCLFNPSYHNIFIDAGLTTDARHNWWGATTGPAAGSITGAGPVITNPVAGASIASAAAALDEDILDDSTTVGVSVTTLADNSLVEVDAIAVAKYSGNPQTVAAQIVGTGSVFGYYDVFFVNQPVITAKPKTYGAVTSIGTGTPQTESYNGVLLPYADTLQIKIYGAVTSLLYLL